jgi:hypothetical protein
MLPILVLIPGHKEVAAMDLAQADIGFVNEKFPYWETHGGRAITAAATLVKYQFSVLVVQLVDQRTGGLGNRNSWYHFFLK